MPVVERLRAIRKYSDVPLQSTYLREMVWEHKGRGRRSLMMAVFAAARLVIC